MVTDVAGAVHYAFIFRFFIISFKKYISIFLTDSDSKRYIFVAVFSSKALPFEMWMTEINILVSPREPLASVPPETHKKIPHP